MEKEKLIIEAASKVHEDWCNQELKAYFDRAQKIYKETDDLILSLESACYKGNTKRNVVIIESKRLLDNISLLDNCLLDYDKFLNLFKLGLIKVKRYTKRSLTLEEQIKAGQDYIDGEENILRDFCDLSKDSQTENLNAAISAYNVFEQFSNAGISIEKMKADKKIRYLIGIAIHTDWLKRNSNHSNESLKVSYSELDDWTKQQDLTVFDALLTVVIQNNITIDRKADYTLPNFEEEEKKTLKLIKK